MNPPSRDLLDFLHGPLLSHQNRPRQLILEWQGSIMKRFFLASSDEFGYWSQLTQALTDLSANIVWLTTGKDWQELEQKDSNETPRLPPKSG